MTTSTNRILAKALFVLRMRLERLRGIVRQCYWASMGLSVGRGTTLPRILVTWPHQILIGARCRLEEDIAFKFDGPWRAGPSIIVGNDVFIGRHCEFNIQGGIVIGHDTLIGSGCRFIDHDHAIAPDRPIASQPCIVQRIELGMGVWLGVNVVVLKGVVISDGAVVGAGSIVRQSIPAGEIWAGVPARKIGMRGGLPAPA